MLVTRHTVCPQNLEAAVTYDLSVNADGRISVMGDVQDGLVQIMKYIKIDPQELFE
jgi:hypothetical protein